MPRVLNKRTDYIPPNAIYVDRPSRWGNPYIIGRDGTREEVIEKFKKYILTTREGANLSALKGVDLVCWCSPKPCHADILLEKANEM